ncbi:unnamed protein product [Urochloa humidicola]
MPQDPPRPPPPAALVPDHRPRAPPGPPPPSSSPTGAMEGESTWDDGLAPLFPPAGGSSSWGFNLSSTNGVQAARTGMESVDLNSQAGDFPHLNDYESYLRGGTFSVGGSMESALAPNRCNRSLGVHRRDAGWSQRGCSGGGRRGQQLDFGGGRAGPMASAPLGGAFGGPSSSGAAAGAHPIAPLGAAGGKRRGTSAYSVRGSASTYSSRGGPSSSGHARSSRGRGRGQRMPREDFYDLQEDDEEAENEFEDLRNSRGKKNQDKANWSDRNTTILLQLCLEQVEAQNYENGNMNTTGYNTIIQKFKEATGLIHDRTQIKTRIGQLRGVYSFLVFLQTHTGLGRKPDGSIDADSTFWKEHTQHKPWLKKLKKGDPPFLQYLEAMFHKEVVDGSNTYVPGQDYGEEGQQEEEAYEEEEEEEDFHHSPMSISSRKSKRSGGSTISTGHSPNKKKGNGRNPIVKVLNKIASTYSHSVSTNEKTIQEHKDSKLQAELQMDAEIEKCQQLAWECVPHDSVEAYATFKIFKSRFSRRYFLTIPTSEGRINFLQRWCKENNMY